MRANEFTESLRTENPCWKGYHPVGTKKKNGKTVPNCVPNANEAANPAQQAAIAIAKKKKLDEFAPVGGDDREPDEEEILRQLAAKWWLGTNQEMAKAQRTLAALGWEIGQDESGDDDAGVFLIRAGDVNGNSYIAFNHSDLELNEDRLDELSFLGSPCTKDCSGHRAGYDWYKRKGRDPFSHSQSFNNGAGLAKAGK